jgi:hypothetical protein
MRLNLSPNFAKALYLRVGNQTLSGNSLVITQQGNDCEVRAVFNYDAAGSNSGDLIVYPGFAAQPAYNDVQNIMLGFHYMQLVQLD